MIEAIVKGIKKNLFFMITSSAIVFFFIVDGYMQPKYIEINEIAKELKRTLSNHFELKRKMEYLYQKNVNLKFESYYDYLNQEITNLIGLKRDIVSIKGEKNSNIAKKSILSIGSKYGLKKSSTGIYLLPDIELIDDFNNSLVELRNNVYLSKAYFDHVKNKDILNQSAAIHLRRIKIKAAFEVKLRKIYGENKKIKDFWDLFPKEELNLTDSRPINWEILPPEKISSFFIKLTSICKKYNITSTITKPDFTDVNVFTLIKLKDSLEKILRNISAEGKTSAPFIQLTGNRGILIVLGIFWLVFLNQNLFYLLYLLYKEIKKFSKMYKNIVDLGFIGIFISTSNITYGKSHKAFVKIPQEIITFISLIFTPFSSILGFFYLTQNKSIHTIIYLIVAFFVLWQLIINIMLLNIVKRIKREFSSNLKCGDSNDLTK